MPTKLPKAYSERGADMGRRSHYPYDFKKPIKLRLERIRLDSGGYDNGGAYWGTGIPLYMASAEEDIRFFLRADNREVAKLKIRADYPNVTFYR